MTEHTHHHDHDHYVHGAIDHAIDHNVYIKAPRQASVSEIAAGLLALLAVLTLGGLALCGQLVTALKVVAPFAIMYGLLWLAPHLYHKRKSARLAREERLRTNAEQEHQYVQKGDDRGVYGDYPVPDSVRGTGLWIADRKETETEE